jgi:tetratricopeptide (TPR) repeat protein
MAAAASPVRQKQPFNLFAAIASTPDVLCHLSQFVDLSALASTNRALHAGVIQFRAENLSFLTCIAPYIDDLDALKDDLAFLKQLDPEAAKVQARRIVTLFQRIAGNHFRFDDQNTLWVWTARELAQKGRLKQASVVAARAQNPALYENLAHIAANLGNFEKTREFLGRFRRAVEAEDVDFDKWPVQERRIQESYMSAAEHAAQRGSFKEAVEYASEIPNPTKRDYAYANLATTATNRGDLEQAANFLGQIQDREERDKTCQLVIYVAAQSEKMFPKAKEWVAQIQDESRKDEAYSALVSGAVHRRNLPQAKECAILIQHQGIRDDAYSGIVIQAVKSGNFPEAEEPIAKIKNGVFFLEIF